MSGKEQQSPSYDALLVIAQSVGAALARAGVTDCDDPGEAIDVMRENLEARVAFLESERRRLQEAAPQPPADAHCATCSCAPGMTPAVRIDTSPAEKEGSVRDHLIRMGWTPPAEAQAQGGGEVRAKPLEWQEDGPGEWCDRHHGFHITQDDEEPQESRFTAAWGECDPERFSTLEEAQAWCQEALDRYIREWVAPAPPSAPVGVESFESRLRGRAGPFTARLGERYVDADIALSVLRDALAQQPAAVDGAMPVLVELVATLAATGTVTGGRIYFPERQTRELLKRACDALAAQPGGDQE